ncbi:MAG: DUF6114 domain-containing protein [Gordonia sp. (in: high G+C Gram-positive bacteria)]
MSSQTGGFGMKEKYRQFRRWTRKRPMAGGVCLLISAIFLSLPALSGFRIGDMVLSVSTISGVSTTLLAVLMALCGFATLFWLHSRVVAGLSAMVIALVAFPAANFGGFVLGTLFGIVGASFALAWRPVPPADDDAAAAEVAGDATVADGTAGVEDTAPIATTEDAAPSEDTAVIGETPAAAQTDVIGVVDQEATTSYEAPAPQEPFAAGLRHSVEADPTIEK